ncbi:MAG: CAP domain-containing protein [Acidobacteriota bacterium]|nr:CAP domain-containing protein [Acidobacteriota bacterium]
MLLTAALLLGLLAADPNAGMPDTTSSRGMMVVTPATLHDQRDPHTVLLGLINQQRQVAGLKPLVWDARLAQAAHDHAEVMSQEGRLSHQFEGEPALLDRLTRRAVRLDSASENVVYDVTPEGAHEAFENSTPHRNNMMNAAYDSVGIAVVNRDGILYVVEDFAHRLFEQDDQAAAERIASGFEDARRQFGLPALERVNNQRMESMVEQMVERESPDSHLPLSLPGARLAAAYATLSPAEIPASIARLAALRGTGAYSVAVQFARTPRYPSGLFWVSIVVYDGNVSYARR